MWEVLSVISGLVPWPLCCPLTHCILGRAGGLLATTQQSIM